MGTQYQFKKQLSILPPREFRSIPLTQDIDIDIVSKFQSLATGFDIEIQTGTALITVNDEPAFTPISTLSQTKDNVLVYHIKITGVTAGYLNLFLHSLNTLQRYDVLENR